LVYNKIMRIKCSCGKIFNCEPKGDCWCKQLDKKIKKSDTDNKISECLCEDCLKAKVNRISYS